MSNTTHERVALGVVNTDVFCYESKLQNKVTSLCGSTDLDQSLVKTKKMKEDLTVSHHDDTVHCKTWNIGVV
ncbi:hypothetical protein GWK47_009288 [Chionoecetes opilio]|uniref:Uncharacterized protein n=1 Tax=Chionoecetes opilio TaxID=41210 RepID=A0A8J4Y4G1_CHIOP|nr:hypothetical protein GWK47_009288 [Chionoecetes opilio]